MLNQEAFLKEIRSSGLELTEAQSLIAARFAEILHRENEEQNLTRIIGAKEYIQGHLVDVLELLALPTLGNRILDI